MAQKSWTIFLAVKDNQAIRQGWVMTKRILTKDITLHLGKLTKIQKVMQLPFKALSKVKRTR